MTTSEKIVYIIKDLVESEEKLRQENPRRALDQAVDQLLQYMGARPNSNSSLLNV